ncbi:MAG: hypothetical protein ACT4PP_03960 [Sporichthyaceae bacterium]
MNKRTVGVAAAFLAIVALTQEPVRSAEGVSDAWDGLFGGAGSVMEGFFTFTEELGPGESAAPLDTE